MFNDNRFCPEHNRKMRRGLKQKGRLPGQGLVKHLERINRFFGRKDRSLIEVFQIMNRVGLGLFKKTERTALIEHAFTDIGVVWTFGRVHTRSPSEWRGCFVDAYIVSILYAVNNVIVCMTILLFQLTPSQQRMPETVAPSVDFFCKCCGLAGDGRAHRCIQIAFDVFAGAFCCGDVTIEQFRALG